MHGMCIFTSLLALALPGLGRADWITSQETWVSVTEGRSVSLLCRYNISAAYYVVLYWFRQYPNKAPEYILHRGWGNPERGVAEFALERFYSKSTANSIDLQIKNLIPADSALYLCALTSRRDTPTDKLIFGQGTQVTVEPKKQPPAKPSVFIMKNGTNVACLVKDFYPKDVNISLRSSKKIAEFDPAIAISPSGKYSAVKLGQYGDSNSVTCSVQHNSETVHSTDFEQYADSVDNVKPTEPAKNDTQTSEPCHSPRVMIHAKKVNTMSLTVLGLRLLLAKTVAINFLLTAKLFF